MNHPNFGQPPPGVKNNPQYGGAGQQATNPRHPPPAQEQYAAHQQHQVAPAGGPQHHQEQPVSSLNQHHPHQSQQAAGGTQPTGFHPPPPSTSIPHSNAVSNQQHAAGYGGGYTTSTKMNNANVNVNVNVNTNRNGMQFQYQQQQQFQQQPGYQHHQSQQHQFQQQQQQHQQQPVHTARPVVPPPPRPLPPPSINNQRGIPPTPSSPRQPPQYQTQPHAPMPTHDYNKNKLLDSSQLPHVNPPTTPISCPSIIYKTSNSTGLASKSTSSTSSTSSPTLPPPPSDTRYIVQDKGNASPRLIKSITQILPKNAAVLYKTGMEMGVLCMPLAVPTEDYDNAGTGTGTGNDNGNGKSGNLEFVPLIHSHYEQHKIKNSIGGRDNSNRDINNNDREGAVKPIRCRYCHAYWNPFVLVERMEVNRAVFRCNFCEKRNDIEVEDGGGRKFHVDVGNLPLRYGSVEYEVDGEYILRSSSSSSSNGCSNGHGNSHGRGKWGAVHLFALDGGDWDKLHLYLKVLANAVEEMDGFWKRQKKYTARMTGAEHIRGYAGKEQGGAGGGAGGAGMVEDHSPRIGFLVYVQDHVLIPHWRRKRRNNANGNGNSNDNDGGGEWELAVSLMTDVKEDPFAPLPLASWTYAVGEIHNCHSHDSAPLYKMQELIRQIPSILKDMLPDYKCRGSAQFSPIESNSWNCGGAALSILGQAMYKVGGRGTLLTSSRLNYGVGMLADRQRKSTKKYADSASEKTLYTPQQTLKTEVGEFYTKLGNECIQEGISLSVIVSSPMGHELGSGVTGAHFVDVATLTELCRHSCGNFKWLRYQESEICAEWNIAIDKEGSYAHQLKEEILQSLDASLGYDAIFKLRCSSGLRIKTYLPKTKSQGKMKDDGISDSPELFLSCIMPDTCITIELEHRIGGIPNALEENGRRSSDSIAYLQTALLYTTAFGNRRVRVTTLALKVAASIPTIFDSANFDSLTAFMTRQAISDIFDHGSLHLARLEILNRCVSILSKYRKHGEVQASPGKLVLAEALQLLPLFCLSLLKSRMFRSSLSRNSSSTCKPSPTADERAFHLWFSSNVSPAMSMLSVHPSLYELNNMASDVGEPVLLKARRNTQSGQTDVDGHFEQDEFDRSSCEPYIQLPPSTKPSVACMRPDGVYLLDDGFHFFLFVGRDVSIDARSEFLSFEEVSDTGQRHVSISTSSDFGSRIWNVISQLRKSYRCSTLERFERPLYSPVIVVIGSGGAGFRTVIDSALEEEMIESLVEDSSSDEKNYEEFLIDIFNRVRNATM